MCCSSLENTSGVWDALVASRAQNYTWTWDMSSQLQLLFMTGNIGMYKTSVVTSPTDIRVVCSIVNHVSSYVKLDAGVKFLSQ